MTIRSQLPQYTTALEVVSEKELFFLEMKKWLRLGFKDGSKDPLNGKDNDLGRSLGFTTCELEKSGKVKQIWIFLEYKDLHSLFRNDLTDCDRMGLQTYIATTLVHEW